MPLALKIDDAKLLMDGTYYTQCLLNVDNSINYIAGYATSRQISIKDTIYIGYVPSVGEISILMEYDTDIQYAFTLIGIDFLNNAEIFLNMATSNQASSKTMWYYRYDRNVGFTNFSTSSKVARVNTMNLPMCIRANPAGIEISCRTTVIKRPINVEIEPCFSKYSSARFNFSSFNIHICPTLLFTNL